MHLLFPGLALGTFLWAWFRYGEIVSRHPPPLEIRRITCVSPDKMTWWSLIRGTINPNQMKAFMDFARATGHRAHFERLRPPHPFWNVANAAHDAAERASGQQLVLEASAFDMPDWKWADVVALAPTVDGSGKRCSPVLGDLVVYTEPPKSMLLLPPGLFLGFTSAAEDFETVHPYIGP